MTLHFAVLGDSIAFGQGATRTQDTVGPLLVADLASVGITARLRVLAVPRACSDALDGQVRQAIAWGAQLALIVIGANDLTHFVPTAQAAGQLGAAVRSMRAAGAQVVVMPAPDLSVVPWVPPQLQAMVKNGSEVLRRAQVLAAQAHGARVADVDGVAASAFASDAKMFSADRFHPSSAGYALIAQALAPAVRAAGQAAVAPAE